MDEPKGAQLAAFSCTFTLNQSAMKNLSIILSIVGFSLSSFLNAQTGKTTVKSSNDQSVVDPNDAKANFVNNKDYLSPSTLKDYKNYYGDSLKGFDEAK